MANIDNVLTSIANEERATLEQLHEIQSTKAPSNVFLPYAHNIYDIDLNTRTIKGPEFLSVRRDHRAEVIYFKIDRFFDYMDLANTICVIEYILPEDTTRIPHLYIVPFYDVSTYLKEGKMIFPWAVGGAATSKKGELEYAIRFYRIEGEGENKKLSYNLNTLPTSSLVLPSMEVDEEAMRVEYDIDLDTYHDLISQLQENKTYWSILL